MPTELNTKGVQIEDYLSDLFNSDRAVSLPRVQVLKPCLSRSPVKATSKLNVRQRRHRVDRGAVHQTVTQQEAEGGSEPDRILHEGRGQAQPASQPAPASLLFTDIILYCKPGSPSKGLCYRP